MKTYAYETIQMAEMMVKAKRLEIELAETRERLDRYLSISKEWNVEEAKELAREMEARK